jgi:hypothetical protein
MSRKTICFIVLGAIGCILGAIGCSGSPAAPSGEVPLDREFSLRPGESATVESTGLRVTFLSVLSDSRCPADAVCVWAGDAVVALSVGRTGVELRSTSAPETALGAYRLRLERVEPYVYSGKTIEPAAYRAVLKVTRA